MRKVRTGLFWNEHGWKLTVLLLGFFSYVLLAVKSGGVLWQGVWVAICAVGYLYLPGKAAAKLFGLSEITFSPLLQLVFGCGSFAALTCVAARFGAVWLLQVAPLALAAAYFLIYAKKSFSLQSIKNALYWVQAQSGKNSVMLLAALWGIGCLLFGLAITLPAAKPSAVGIAMVPNQDLLWNIGNAKSFSLAFPPQDIRFSQVRFSYHYLTELIWGGLAMVSGIDAYDIIAFWSGPLVLAALLCALWNLGKFFYHDSENRSLLFIFLLLFANCASGIFAWEKNGLGVFGNSNFLHLFTNINAQASILIFLCAFIILFGNAARLRFKVSFRYLVAMCCCFLLCSVAKGPSAAIVMCSFVITMLIVILFQKPDYLKAIGCVVGVVGIFFAVYLFLFSSGANNSMVFGVKTIQDSVSFGWLEEISDRLRLGYFGLVFICIVQWFLMQPTQFLLYLRGLPQDVKHLFKLPAERLLANGCIAGGMLAYFLFWHQSYSQVYFALLAFFFTSLLGADAAAKVKLPAAKAVISLLAAWAVLSTGMMAASVGAKALPILQQNLTGPTASVTADDETAMEWLKNNTEKRTKFATNRIHSYPDANNGISNIYTALSGRQAYMEGYTYALTNMGVSQPVLDEKIATNQTIFYAGNAQETLRLCKENEIEYLIYDASYGGNLAGFAALKQVYSSEKVFIFQVDEQ